MVRIRLAERKNYVSCQEFAEQKILCEFHQEDLDPRKLRDFKKESGEFLLLRHLLSVDVATLSYNMLVFYVFHLL